MAGRRSGGARYRTRRSRPMRLGGRSRTRGRGRRGSQRWILGVAIGLLLALVFASAAVWDSRRHEAAAPVLAATVVYTAPTANQASIRISGAAREMLEQAGRDHQHV